MKIKIMIALTAFACGSAQADFIGLSLDTHLGQTNDNDKSSAYVGDVALRFKHFIPVVPNVAVEANQRSQGEVADGTSYVGELYYNLFDSLGVYLDLGAAYESWSADNSVFSGVSKGEQLYASGRFTWYVPATNFGLKTDIKYPLATDDYEHARFRAGLTYRLIGDSSGIDFTLGYQYEELKIADNIRSDNSGAYLGLGVKF